MHCQYENGIRAGGASGWNEDGRSTTATAAEQEAMSTPLDNIILGLDPGESTGFAIASRGELIDVMSGDLWTIARQVLGFHRTGRLLGVVVEDSRSLPIYQRHNRKPMKRDERDKLCRNVGRVDRDCALWEAFLIGRGIPYVLRKPSKQKKWDARLLERITGYTKPTNQHGRDAARLVWGCSPMLFQLQEAA